MTQKLDPQMIDGVFATAFTTVTNWNAITASGPYYGADTASNSPGASYYLGLANMRTSDEGWVAAIRAGLNECWYRRKFGGTWSAWVRLDYPITQAEAEGAASTVVGLVSGQRINQALVAGLGAAIAGQAVNAIGAYGFFRYDGNSLAPGATTAGSNLKWASVTEGATNVGYSPSGTWMCCGYHGDSVYRLSVFRRVS